MKYELGQQILCRGEYVAVTDIVRHAPGTHPDSPIHNHLTAVEYLTVRGSRWWGESEGRDLS